MKDQIIQPENILLIKDIPGYSPDISRLICRMNYVRRVTLSSVKGLSVKELDFQLDKESNSIGALLLHMASVSFFIRNTVLKKEI